MRGQATIGGVTLILMMLGGCSQQKPLPALRTSAEHHIRMGELEAAAADYREITVRKPGDWRAHAEYGKLMLELGNLNEAQRSLEVAHTHRMFDEDVIEALASTMLRRDDKTRLYAFLQRQIELAPSPEGHMRLARYAMACSDPDTARLSVNTAIEIDNGRSVEPYLLAARLADRVDDQRLALRRLRQAYGINPDDSRVTDSIIAHGEVPGPTIALMPGR